MLRSNLQLYLRRRHSTTIVSVVNQEVSKNPVLMLLRLQLSFESFIFIAAPLEHLSVLSPHLFLRLPVLLSQLDQFLLRDSLEAGDVLTDSQHLTKLGL